jgi:hypothetical protein
MKKLLAIILSIVCLSSCLTLASCGKKDEEPTPFKVNFYVDDVIYHSVETMGRGRITLPEAPEKVGYKFDGWYWGNDKFTSDTFIKKPFSSDSDIRVDAKFVKNSGGIEGGFPTPDGGEGDGYFDDEGWTDLKPGK